MPIPPRKGAGCGHRGGPFGVKAGGMSTPRHPGSQAASGLAIFSTASVMRAASGAEACSARR